MSTGRKYDRNEGVYAYPLEVSEIERFRGAMEKGGNCTVPLSFSFCFLDICWPRGACRIVEDWIGMPRRAPDLAKGEKPKRGLEGMERGRPEAIRGNGRRSGLEFHKLVGPLCGKVCNRPLTSAVS